MGDEMKVLVLNLVRLSHCRLTNPDHVMLSGSKHLYHDVRDPSVAENRFFRVTFMCFEKVTLDLEESAG
jgi:hypothetical protein